MKLHRVSLVLSFILALFLFFPHFSASCNAAAQLSFGLQEVASVGLNCTTAEVNVYTLVTSHNDSLVHFPSGIAMNSANLANATSVLVIFTSNISWLYYQFNGTTGAEARTITDALTPSVSTSCQTSFTWNSTAEGSANTNVTYVGPGKQNLKQHTESLMSQCLVSDLAGFSLVFPNVTEGSDATAQIAATKTSGDSNWTYSMGASCASYVSPSLNPHTMGILNLLRVSAIAPSPYALSSGFYSSTVTVVVLSNTPETFLSSQPENVSSPLQRGWLIMTTVPPPGALAANFYFGNNASPVSSLTLTFSGTIIPEFPTTSMLIVLLVLPLIIAVPHVFRRRQERKASD